MRRRQPGHRHRQEQDHGRHRRRGDLHDHQRRHRTEAAPAKGSHQGQRRLGARHGLDAERRRHRHQRLSGSTPVDSGPTLQSDTWTLSESGAPRSLGLRLVMCRRQAGHRHRQEQDHGRHRRRGDLHDHKQRHRTEAASAQAGYQQQRRLGPRQRLDPDRQRHRHQRSVRLDPGRLRPDVAVRHLGAV